MSSLIGYCDKLSVRSGETIEFKISAGEGDYSAQLVRLICGNAHCDFPPFKEIEVPASINGNYPGRRQSIARGSYVAIEQADAFNELTDFTLLLTFMPTAPRAGRQHLISRWDEKSQTGWTLQLTSDARLAFTLAHPNGATSEVVSEHTIDPKHWYRVIVGVSPSRKSIVLTCLLHAAPALFHGVAKHRSSIHNSSVEIPRGTTPLLIGAGFMGRRADASIVPAHCFNGRLESPIIYRGLLTDSEADSVLAGERPTHLAGRLFADWDFSRRMTGIEIMDCSPNALHGRTHNLPLRGVRGSRWDGSSMAWPHQPEGYAAIHFHDDDLYDCRWDTDITYRVDAGLKSGIYALRLRQEGKEEYLPFFVAAPKGKPQAKVAFLLPTHTYMAYGNVRVLGYEGIRRARAASGLSEEEFARTLLTGPGTEHYGRQIDEHEEIGSSTYDLHSDGSPVHLSSWLRPLLNMRPKTIWFTFCADLLTIDWLEAAGFSYDIITDDLLQSEGVSLLRDYSVVISGNHPEYVTSEHLDALRSYLEGGGRLMYLGGNGYYWRTACHESLPGVIEVRRGRGATQTWKSEAGEDHLAFTGDIGGLWRDIGRPPQQLVGVGFIAFGSSASHYRVSSQVRQSRAAFVLDGVDEEIIGDFGGFGGAAGQEIDQTNAERGTPAHAIVLARSEGHGPQMVYVIEEMHGTDSRPERYGTQVAAEMVFFETPNGGAVFTVGSMAWCGSLAHNNYQNNVARITDNVLRRFLRPEKFEYPL